MLTENNDDFFLPKLEKEGFDEWLKKFNSEKSMSDMSLADLITRYKQINSTLKDLEMELKSLRDALIMRSKDQQLDPYGLKVEKVARKGSINYKMIPELQSIDLEKYRDEQIEYWKISEVKNDMA